MTFALRAALCDFGRTVGDLLGAAGRALAFVLIWAYRLLIKPLFPTTCRFEPSCSEYALQAVKRFGIFHGGWLALKRVGRCNPWGPFGADPVPDNTRPHDCGRHHSA